MDAPSTNDVYFFNQWGLTSLAHSYVLSIIKQEFVDYIVGELETDIWERVAAEMIKPGSRLSVRRDRDNGDGGTVHTFVNNLSQLVNGRQVSRRSLIPAHSTT